MRVSQLVHATQLLPQPNIRCLMLVHAWREGEGLEEALVKPLRPEGLKLRPYLGSLAPPPLSRWPTMMDQVG